MKEAATHQSHRFPHRHQPGALTGAGRYEFSISHASVFRKARVQTQRRCFCHDQTGRMEFLFTGNVHQDAVRIPKNRPVYLPEGKTGAAQRPCGVFGRGEKTSGRLSIGMRSGRGVQGRICIPPGNEGLRKDSESLRGTLKTPQGVFFPSFLPLRQNPIQQPVGGLLLTQQGKLFLAVRGDKGEHVCGAAESRPRLIQAVGGDHIQILFL